MVRGGRCQLHQAGERAAKSSAGIDAYNKDWPDFRRDPERLVPHLSAARYKQGLLLGNMQERGYALRDGATLAALAEETGPNHKPPASYPTSSAINFPFAKDWHFCQYLILS